MLSGPGGLKILFHICDFSSLRSTTVTWRLNPMKRRGYGFKYYCWRIFVSSGYRKALPSSPLHKLARLFTNRKSYPRVLWKGQSFVFKQNWLRFGFWLPYLLAGWGLSEIINAKLYQYSTQYLALISCSIKTMPTLVRNELKIEIFWLYILCFYLYNAIFPWGKIKSKIIQGELSFTRSFFFSKYLTLNKEKKIYVISLLLWQIKGHFEFF